jgi:hypothetical protein
LAGDEQSDAFSEAFELAYQPRWRRVGTAGFVLALIPVLVWAVHFSDMSLAEGTWDRRVEIAVEEEAAASVRWDAAVGRHDALSQRVKGLPSKQRSYAPSKDVLARVEGRFGPAPFDLELANLATWCLGESDIGGLMGCESERGVYLTPEEAGVILWDFGGRVSNGLAKDIAQAEQDVSNASVALDGAEDAADLARAELLTFNAHNAARFSSGWKWLVGIILWCLGLALPIGFVLRPRRWRATVGQRGLQIGNTWLPASDIVKCRREGQCLVVQCTGGRRRVEGPFQRFAELDEVVNAIQTIALTPEQRIEEARARVEAERIQGNLRGRVPQL